MPATSSIAFSSKSNWVLLGGALLCLAMAGCGAKATTANAPVAAPAPREPADAPEPPDQPLSAPQTMVSLPPPQEIPEGAAPAETGPLAVVEGPMERPNEGQRSPAVSTQPRETSGIAVEQPSAEQQPAALPQLAPMMTTAERRAMLAELDRSLTATRNDLDAIVRRPLNADQQASVRRIRAFIKQAEDVREQDLSLARNLARRARVLAEGLARSVR